MKKIALVTGGNRGIGLEICRELARLGIEVILSSRDHKKGQEAASALSKEGLHVHPVVLDVSRIDSIQSTVAALTERFGRLDILVNNAGILPDQAGQPTPPEAMIETFKTNAMGPYYLSEAVLPLMAKNHHGRIVNISSGMGQLSEMEGGWPAYRLSKTALNAVTRIIADEGRELGVKVNSMCPGWVRTDMGGPDADRSVEEAADTAIWLATLPEDGPTGGFFRDRKPIAW